MRKPQERYFLTGYIAVWLSLVVWAGYEAGPTAIIGVNLLFISINLIGTVFAMGGHVPWRDNDPELLQPPKISRLPSQRNPENRIVADSSDWTGRH